MDKPEMLTVYHYLEIRTAHAQGESIRSISRRLGHSQKSIRKAIASPTGEPMGYIRLKPLTYPKLGGYLEVIDQILLADESAPPKQRHTAMQVYRRLLKEHQYPGKYDQVRRYINQHRHRERETFIPLCQAPATRAECDFGQVYVDFPTGRELVSVLIVIWSFSHLPFMVALPSQRIEAVLEGMVLAFEFFGCVPLEVWWDNPATVVREILKGRDRRLNPSYAALASHYRFTPLFCMPAKGQEKSDVESSVRGLQKRFCTPVPQMADLEEFNRFLLKQCQGERDRRVSGQQLCIGENFALEQQKALPLPGHRFDPCIQRTAIVDKYQMVQLDSSHYSVPRNAAFCPVTIKAYVDRVVVVYQGRVIATHSRSYGRGESVLDPLHYLAALSRKPGCLDHSGVFRHWKLPEVFLELRATLEQQHGLRTGTRHYIRVLQLLVSHPQERITQAIAKCRGRQTITAEIIAQKVEILANLPAMLPMQTTMDLEIASRVRVPAVDLRQFDQLLHAQGQRFGEGDQNDVRPSDAALEAPSQDVTTSHDVGGICQALA